MYVACVSALLFQGPVQDPLRKEILLPADRLIDPNVKVGQRDGTIIEKGVILNENYLEENLGNIGSVMSIFTAYPDVYLDLIKP